jgi:branched-subunit amino acid aminotransferase/4-amino-4-deoxychorismate lyase
LTPPANDLILHGVTRDSVIKIIKKMNRFKVTERMIDINEIVKGIKENRVYEIFTSGCAVTIGSVLGFTLNGLDYKLNVDEKIGAGKFTYEVYKIVTDI